MNRVGWLAIRSSREARAKDGGPDFHQLEPNDELDAVNRRPPEGRVKRFAKRKSTSRPSSLFLVNPSLFSTSQIQRLGWRRLWTRCFGASQGQSWGEFHTRRISQPMRVIDCLTRNDPPDTSDRIVETCRKNGCFKEFEDVREARASRSIAR